MSKLFGVRFARLLGIFAINLVIIFILLEIILRLQEPYYHFMAKGDHDSPNNLIVTQYHPIWNHQVRANLENVQLRVGADGGVSYSMTTNAWGCRYPEVSVPKPEGTFRIIVIGDSFTQGYHLEDTVAYRLERELYDEFKGIDFEVLNCASGSYSPLLIYLRLRDHLMDIEPDAIIVNVDQTDMYDDYWRYRHRIVVDDSGKITAVTKENWKFIESIKIAMEMSAAIRTLVSASQRTALLLRVIRQTNETENKEDRSAIPSPTYENIYWFHSVSPLENYPEWETAFQELSKNVENIISLCSEKKIPCAFTTYPHVNQISTKTLESSKQHREFPIRLKKFVEDKGLFFFDAYAAIAQKQNQGRSLYFTTDMHLNEEGQKVWSTVFAENLSPWVSKQIKKNK